MYIIYSLFFLFGFSEAVGTYYVENYCGRSITITTSIFLKFNNNIFVTNKCEVTLKVDDSRDSILLAFRKLELYTQSAFGTSISTTWTSGERFKDSLEMSRVYYGQSGSKVTLSYKDASFLNELELSATAVGSGECYKRFSCDNLKCISKQLKCDDHNNCGDRSDEHNCGLTTGGIIGVVIAGICIVIITSVILVKYCTRRHHDTVTTITTTHPEHTYGTHPTCPTAYPQQTYPPSYPQQGGYVQYPAAQYPQKY